MQWHFRPKRTGDDFALEATGFDINRDLKVVCTYPGEPADA